MNLRVSIKIYKVGLPCDVFALVFLYVDVQLILGDLVTAGGAERHVQIRRCCHTLVMILLRRDIECVCSNGVRRLVVNDRRDHFFHSVRRPFELQVVHFLTNGAMVI